jgi:DNA-binding transcriptional MocR family regulator
VTTTARAAYDGWLERGLRLDLTRGKPCPEQLTLSERLLDRHDAGFTASDGDVRNYGGAAAGLREIREIFAPALQVPVDQLCAADNSSLALMYQAIMTSFFDSPDPDAPAWAGSAGSAGCQPPTFLCPVPGYDRHFTVCADLGVRLTAVPTTADGPDLDVVERLAAEDASVKGLWCVPKYSNPSGWTCSPEVVRRLAEMPTAATDFRIYWDNAYAVHHLTDTPDELADLLAACERAGHADRAFVFGSTSKITFAGGGVSFFGSSSANVEWWQRHAGKRTIGPDKINQLQHARFLESPDGLARHMVRHREILQPKFAAVQATLAARLSGVPDVSWTEPNGGYFVSLTVPSGRARRVVQLADRVGVKLTPAGAPYPGGVDPDDRTIRLAPTYPSLDDLRTALEVVADCVLVAVEEGDAATH